MSRPFFFKPNEVSENEVVAYSPIRGVLAWLSIDFSNKAKDVQSDYRKEKNRGKIVGLLVYKETGEWAWVMDN
jgi:hypothetical protein